MKWPQWLKWPAKDELPPLTRNQFRKLALHYALTALSLSAALFLIYTFILDDREHFETSAYLAVVFFTMFAVGMLEKSARLTQRRLEFLYPNSKPPHVLVILCYNSFIPLAIALNAFLFFKINPVEKSPFWIRRPWTTSTALFLLLGIGAPSLYNKTTDDDLRRYSLYFYSPSLTYSTTINANIYEMVSLVYFPPAQLPSLSELTSERHIAKFQEPMGFATNQTRILRAHITLFSRFPSSENKLMTKSLMIRDLAKSLAAWEKTRPLKTPVFSPFSILSPSYLSEVVIFTSINHGFTLSIKDIFRETIQREITSLEEAGYDATEVCSLKELANSTRAFDGHRYELEKRTQ